ncbi:MAG: hypothetical protein PF495_04850, partial [Spirochaetales bacterium]|nr:hypothetical protein [Spirochaetales bacterium]
IFTDTTTTNQLVVEIEKDVTEKFVWGGYWGLNGCDFISCSGWVESFSVSGTIEVACDTGSAIFTGTINAEGTTISGTYKEYDGLGDPTGGSGSFTATRQSRETETETIDFNCIFGNNTTPVKSPLNIRAILPDFDQYNEMIPGTFQGTPVLNGIIPDLQTNYDLTREMDLQPSGEFPIPTKTINVQDGDVSDWSDIDPVFTDITGEDKYDFIGDDIAALYLAKDDTNLYVRMTLTEPPNISSPDSNGGSMHYFVQLARSRHASAWSDRYFGVKYNSDNWEVMVHQYAGYSVIGDHPTGFAQAVGNDLEWKVPLSELETPFTGYFLNAWSHWTPSSYNCSDGNHTGLRVGPLASISGTITCTAHNGTGNIFIYAYDGSNPNTANELGSAYISAPGSYEITGLPVGANVYLFARWDADDNGIKTFGDYVGMTGPIPVESGGTTGVDFSLNTLIDDSFIMTKLGVYRVFGSNNFLSDVYGGFFDIDWGYDWTFIGEGNSTQTFTSNMYYEKILIIWDGETKFNFDSFEDQTANTAFAVDEYGDSTGYSWSTSNLRNFDSSDSSYYGEPSYFKGHSDGLYAVTDDWYGYSLFTMPGDTKDNSTSRQLKITLISTLTGDLNGDTKVNLADAILALKVVAGLNPTGINSSADVNGDGKIGLAEVIYILQHVVGLRDGGQGAGAEYTASGTYAYDSGAASLTLNTTSSDFVCEGPEAEVPETFTVITLTATTMVWEESDGHQMTWTRDTGTSGEIVGTWAQYDEPNSWELMVNSDSSFVVVGYIVECGYEDYVSIDGNVFEGEGYLADHTNPVQGAVVSTSLDSQTAITDANGHFFLQTNTPAEYSSTPYTITISASGYQTYSGTWTWGDHPVGQEFCLSSLR